MPDIRKQLRLMYRRIGDCLEKCRPCRRSNRVSPEPETLSKRKEERIAAGFSGEAKRQKDIADEMRTALGTDQNPKVAAGGVVFDINFYPPKHVRNGPRPLVDFTAEEKSLMDDIIKMADAKPDDEVKYTAAEKEALAELLHADILRVISESSSSAKRQAKAAANRDAMNARAAKKAENAKATLTATERRDRVQAMAAKDRRQAATATPMPNVDV